MSRRAGSVMDTFFGGFSFVFGVILRPGVAPAAGSNAAIFVVLDKVATCSRRPDAWQTCSTAATFTTGGRA